MCGRVRLSSDYSEIKIRLKFAPDAPGAELRARLEQAADRADARGDPLGRRQARAQDDEVEFHSSLGEGRQAPVLDLQRARRGFRDQAFVSRRLEMGPPLPRRD